MNRNIQPAAWPGAANSPPASTRMGTPGAWMMKIAHSALLLLAAALSACGGGDSGPVTSTEVPIAITAQPTNQSVSAGVNAVFAVAATGTSISYQWQSSPNGVAAWTPIAGATSATLTLTAVPALDNGRQIRVTLMNGLGSVVSTTAVVTVATAGVVPVVNTQPVGASVVVPQAVRFSVAADGSPPPSFQWQRSTDSGATFQDIIGATGTDYTTPATTVADNGARFRVVVTNSAGSVTSNAATLTATTTVTSTVGPSPKPVALAVGDTVCASRADDTLACWGLNTDYEIPGATLGYLLRPTTALGVRSVVSLSGGPGHFCALTANADVVCWGENSYGQLGNGVQFGFDRGPLQPAGLAGSKAVASGKYFSCAIRGDGSVACWGRNSEGQLGDGTNTLRTSPTAVLGIADAVAITAGSRHACALRATGIVACWGSNGTGELGDGTTVDRRSPGPVQGLTNVVAIAAAAEDFSFPVQNHTCALKSDGTVACWGSNVSGQLGIGSVVDQSRPTSVPGLSGVTGLTAGRFHTCALKSDGTVACWGSNGSGQLGTGNEIDQNRPTAVPGLTNVVAIVAGGYNTCAVRADASLWCWGTNIYAGLGDGTLVSKSVPTLVQGLTIRLQ